MKVTLRSPIKTTLRSPVATISAAAQGRHQLGHGHGATTREDSKAWDNDVDCTGTMGSWDRVGMTTTYSRYFFATLSQKMIPAASTRRHEDGTVGSNWDPRRRSAWFPEDLKPSVGRTLHDTEFRRKRRNLICHVARACIYVGGGIWHAWCNS